MRLLVLEVREQHTALIYGYSKAGIAFSLKGEALEMFYNLIAKIFLNHLRGYQGGKSKKSFLVLPTYGESSPYCLHLARAHLQSGSCKSPL